MLSKKQLSRCLFFFFLTISVGANAADRSRRADRGLVSNLPNQPINYLLDRGFEEFFFPYYIYCPRSDHLIDLFANLFQSYQLHYTLSEEYRIPKLVHFIWLGSPLPVPCQAIVESWKRVHPDWTVRVWTDADVEEFGLQNKMAFDIANNYGEKSDIFRYEILYRYGGVYVDTDFECLKPFDPLHRSCDFYTGLITSNGSVDLLNGMVGSCAGHPIMRACIDFLQVGNGDQNPNRIMNDTGPYFFRKMFLKTIGAQDCGTAVALPPNMLYPFPGGHRFFISDRQQIKRLYARPESLAIHYWSTSWVKKISTQTEGNSASKR